MPVTTHGNRHQRQGHDTRRVSVQWDGVPMPLQPTINFVGSEWGVTNDPQLDRLNIVAGCSAALQHAPQQRRIDLTIPGVRVENDPQNRRTNIILDRLPHIMVIWSGIANNVPTGWKLCDGGTYYDYCGNPVVTPNMTAKFLCSYGDNAEFGTVVGADTIDITHQHDTNGATFDATGSEHTHDANIPTKDCVEISLFGASPPTQVMAIHMHYANDTTTTNDGAHTHAAISTPPTGNPLPASVDNRPLFYSRAYIMHISGLETDIPIGCVAWWSGYLDTIPTNYQLADGTNGAQNFLNMFIRHPGSYGATGGQDAKTWEHEHYDGWAALQSGDAVDDTHVIPTDLQTSGTVNYTPQVGGATVATPESHTHPSVNIDLPASNHHHHYTPNFMWPDALPGDVENRPPYYALYYIQRMS
jgi:hypothetical protein